MNKKRKFLSVIAFMAAAAMLASGCGSNNDSEEGTTTASVNVIGEESTTGSADGSAGEALTDASGETITGVNGDVLTVPSDTVTLDPAQTLSDEDILNAMTTAATEPPQLNLHEVDIKDRYGYNTLNDKEKELYNMIVEGMENLRYKICEEDAYTLEEWAKIYGMVYMQEPRFFYMNSKVKVGKLFCLTKDADAINEMQKSIDAVADKLVAEANGKSSTFEKLKVFHDYLALNSTFELKGGTSSYNATIYNAFGSGEAQGNIQCAGYAKAIQYLCDKAGITCMVVTGETAEGQSHAWNVVDVDGKWYNFDVTWDDPILSEPNYKNIRYNYFLVPDSGMHNITHMHVGEKKLANGDYIKYFDPPACTDNAQNYFVKNGIVYSDFDSAEAALKAEIERAAKDGSRTAEVAVSSKDIYDKLYAKRKDYNQFAKGLSGVKGLTDNCSESLLIIELDVLYS